MLLGALYLTWILWKMNMRFGTWNVKNLYRTGSLKTLARELAKYKLDLLGVQEVRSDKDGSWPADSYIILYGKLNVNPHFVTAFCM
jgi:exonuclease III